MAAVCEKLKLAEDKDRLLNFWVLPKLIYPKLKPVKESLQ